MLYVGISFGEKYQKSHISCEKCACLTYFLYLCTLEITNLKYTYLNYNGTVTRKV